jgi:dolichol-phosphate mannosyltransferase
MPDAVLIPTRNEDLRVVQALVKGVQAHRVKRRVFVVDDSDPYVYGSGGYLVPGKGSLGASLVEGIREARDDTYEGPTDRVAVIDAGGSHDPFFLRRLLAIDADVVIGSRFCPGGAHRGPWWRQVGSRVYARAFSWLFDVQIKDWTSGYRVYSAKAIDAILASPPKSKRHAVQAEMLATCLNAGCTVQEVPIEYLDGDSSFSWAAAREALALWFREAG